MALALEVATDRMVVSLLQRAKSPFEEEVLLRGRRHTIHVRHEYPIYVGIGKRDGLGLEVWRQYISDPDSQLRRFGKLIGGWTGDEVEAYRAFKYPRGPRRQDAEIESHFIRDRRVACDLGLPLETVDQMFTRPQRGIPKVVYIDTVVGPVIKEIIFE